MKFIILIKGVLVLGDNQLKKKQTMQNEESIKIKISAPRGPGAEKIFKIIEKIPEPVLFKSESTLRLELLCKKSPEK